MTLLFELFIIFFSVFIIATISASLGIGGGLFTVPLLLFLGKFHLLPEESIAHISIANSLLVAFILSTSATWINLKNNQVNIRLAITFLTGSIPGALVGVLIFRFLNTKELTFIFGSLVLLIGVISFIKNNRNNQKQNTPQWDQTLLEKQQISNTLFYWTILLPIGFITGLISSLTGVGGGIIMVPIFSYFLKNEPFQKSISTSSFSMTIITLSSSILYMFQHTTSVPQPSIGYYYLPFTLPLIFGSVPGGIYGAKLKGKLPQKSLKNSLSVLQILIGLKVLLW